MKKLVKRWLLKLLVNIFIQAEQESAKDPDANYTEFYTIQQIRRRLQKLNVV